MKNCIKSKHRRTIEPQLISLDNSRMLKGILPILIIFHHSSLVLSYDISDGVIYFFESIGYILTGIFFILSGYGVMKQIESKGFEYLISFWKSRFKKIILPFLILSMICFCMRFFADEYNMGVFWAKFRIGDYPVPYSWYIIALLAEEIFFYVCFKLLHFKMHIDLKWIIALLFLLTAGMVFIYQALGFGIWYYSSLFCFPLGMLIEHFETFLIRKLWFVIAISSSSCVLLFFMSDNIMFIVYRNLFSMFLGVLIISIVYLINIKIKVFMWLSDYSLEVYLIHGILLFGISSVMSSNKGEIMLIIVVIMSIICAVVWKKIYYSIYERIAYGKNRNIER